MQLKPTTLKDCFIIEPRVFKDSRGFFFESFNKDKFKDLAGFYNEFIQDNLAFSTQGVVRGLHFQKGDAAQAKLVSCIKGRIIDVAVDLRPDSPTFRQHFAVELTEENHWQLYVPRGFAHGYSVLSETALVQYKVDNVYAPQAEGGIIFNDPSLAIDWKVESPIVSDKDLILTTLDEYLQSI